MSKPLIVITGASSSIDAGIPTLFSNAGYEVSKVVGDTTI